ncbi:MAG: hypothetical protein K0U72_03490 [Gammaproteobacteria bacterium]|nr:hypothetical protein [Gammaproteobacteria bacterium]
MFNQTTARRDAFTFSLGGMATIAAVVIAPAIADDRLNLAKQEQPQCSSPGKYFKLGTLFRRYRQHA